MVPMIHAVIEIEVIRQDRGASMTFEDYSRFTRPIDVPYPQVPGMTLTVCVGTLDVTARIESASWNERTKTFWVKLEGIKVDNGNLLKEFTQDGRWYAHEIPVA